MVAFGETLRKVGYHAVNRLLSKDVEIGVSGGSEVDCVGGAAVEDADATEGMADVQWEVV